MAKTTRADDVATAIRADILAGRLRPGDRLKFQDLTKVFDASIGVMREALGRLVDTGLVEVEPHQGFRVKSLSYVELNDLTTARMEIEPLVFKDALAHGDLQWEADVMATHHVLSQTPMFEVADPLRLSDEWSEAHERFHGALLHGATNERLRAFALRLREEAELYRRWSVSLPAAEPHRDLPGEHQRLLHAAVSRDAEHGPPALRDHIARTTELVLEGANDVIAPESGLDAHQAESSAKTSTRRERPSSSVSG